MIKASLRGPSPVNDLPAQAARYAVDTVTRAGFLHDNTNTGLTTEIADLWQRAVPLFAQLEAAPMSTATIAATRQLRTLDETLSEIADTCSSGRDRVRVQAMRHAFSALIDWPGVDALADDEGHDEGLIHTAIERLSIAGLLPNSLFNQVWPRSCTCCNGHGKVVRRVRKLPAKYAEHLCGCVQHNICPRCGHRDSLCLSAGDREHVRNGGSLLDRRDPCKNCGWQWDHDPTDGASES